jgi:hypothetical protein
MNPVERNVLPARGPKFSRGPSGEVLFEFVIDATNIVGPRPAKTTDVRDHGGAFQEFCRDGGPCSRAEMEAMGFETVEPFAPAQSQAFNGADPAKFDHDGDGQPGGSLRQEHSQGQPEGLRARRGRKARAQ